MFKKKQDLNATQEIKIPKSKYDYRDGFDYLPDTSNAKKEDTPANTKNINFNKRALMSIFICLISIFVVIVVAYFVILFTPLNEKTQNVSTTSQKLEYTTSLNTQASTSKIQSTTSSDTQTFTQNTTTSISPTTTEQEITETPTTTEETTIIQTDPTTIIQEPVTEVTQEPTIINKSMQVSDISVQKTESSLFISTISGNFSGYLPEELVEYLTVTTTYGIPKITSYYFSDSSTLTVISNLEECSGQLHICLDNFNFYQDMSSFQY